MRRDLRAGLVMFVVLVGGLLLGLGAEAGPAKKVPSVTDLHWLAGCWASVDSEAGSGEQWTAPAGGTLLGVSRTIKGGRTVAHEFLMIRAVDEGRIEYVAQPSGQSETIFELVEVGPHKAVFSNPEHDFPQRIVYERTGDRLVARIEGEVRGEKRTLEFAFEKID